MKLGVNEGVGVVCWRAQEQTPSYLPSYTRLGHAIPGSKTVSVGGCMGVCRCVCARSYTKHEQ